MPLSDEHLKSISLEDTMFVIGSGPSLNKIDVPLLKDLNTFGMNRQYIAFGAWGFSPKYYAILDWRLIHKIYEEEVVPEMLDNPECTTEKYFISNPGTAPEYVKEGGSTADPNVDVREEHQDKVILITTYSTRLSEDVLKKINLDAAFKKHEDDKGIFFRASGGYGNCGVWATTLSYVFGYKRVILLGIDAKYYGREKSIALGYDVEHFHPLYFDPKEFKELETHGEPDKWNGTFLWDYLKNHKDGLCNRPDFEIISCTPNSIINNDQDSGMFDYVDLKHLLKLHGVIESEEE